MKLQISGTVIHGDHYGRKLGFPTANLERRSYSRLQKKPKLGIWAGQARIKNLKPASPSQGGLKIENWLPAAIVIGPLDAVGLPKIEAHLIGYQGSLYGKKLALTLQSYIRPFKKYTNEADLKKQIAADIKYIKNL